MGNQSKILKILAFVAGFVVLYVLYLSWHNRQGPAQPAQSEVAATTPDAVSTELALPLPGEPAKSQSEQLTVGDLTPDELRALGADADSPAETLKTLVAEISKLRKENADVKAKSDAVLARNQSLSQMEANLKTQFDERLAQERSRLANEAAERQKSERTSMMSDLESRFSTLTADNAVLSALGGSNSSNNPSNKSSSVAADDQLYQGLGITPGAVPSQRYPVRQTANPSKPDPYGTGSGLLAPNDDEVVWIKPMDAIVEPVGTGGAGGNAGALAPIRYPEVDLTGSNASAATPGPELASTAPASAPANKATLPKPDIKAYTIPQNATLMGSVTMTSLIGRIMRKGSLFDPYPFKLLIGDENLAANGIFIPNVSGIVVTGYASGDWTLSCVSGTVTSLTFVFQDGTIRTYPKPGAGKSKSATESLGWLSDTQGVPCISGERITNAPSFLLQRIGLTLGSAYYAAAAASETTTSSNQYNGGDSTSVTGDKGAYAKNQAISAGVDEGADWLRERQEQEFDAVYVKPGQEVAFHLDQEIAIDFEQEGRQVDHHAILPFQKTPSKRSRRLD